MADPLCSFRRFPYQQATSVPIPFRNQNQCPRPYFFPHSFPHPFEQHSQWQRPLQPHPFGYSSGYSWGYSQPFIQMYPREDVHSEIYSDGSEEYSEDQYPEDNEIKETGTGELEAEEVEFASQQGKKATTQQKRTRTRKQEKAAWRTNIMLRLLLLLLFAAKRSENQNTEGKQERQEVRKSKREYKSYGKTCGCSKIKEPPQKEGDSSNTLERAELRKALKNKLMTEQISVVTVRKHVEALFAKSEEQEKKVLIDRLEAIYLFNRKHQPIDYIEMRQIHYLFSQDLFGANVQSCLTHFLLKKMKQEAEYCRMEVSYWNDFTAVTDIFHWLEDSISISNIPFTKATVSKLERWLMVFETEWKIDDQTDPNLYEMIRYDIQCRDENRALFNVKGMKRRTNANSPLNPRANIFVSQSPY